MLRVNEWAQQQWGAIELGDKRRNNWAVQLGARIAALPDATLPARPPLIQLSEFSEPPLSMTSSRAFDWSRPLESRTSIPILRSEGLGKSERR